MQQLRLDGNRLRSLFGSSRVCWLLLACIFGPSEFRPAIAAEPIAAPLIDTHVHLWDLDRPAGIYWIAEDNKTLRRSFLPRDLEPVANANSVEGVVVVQAGQSLPDNQWNLDITAHNKKLFRGVVGNLSPVIGTDEFRPLFESLCRDPRYVGYRLSGRPRPELSDQLIRDLQLTADQGKTVDFLVNEYSLADVAEIARRVPKLRIIIDHFGSVQLNGKPLDLDWVKQLQTTAEHKNVYCKVSALYGRTKQQPAPTDNEYYREVWDLVFASFGEDRLIYGSDWPVTEMTGDYQSVVKLTRAYLDTKGATARDKVLYRNAEVFYGLQKP